METNPFQFSCDPKNHGNFLPAIFFWAKSINFSGDELLYLVGKTIGPPNVLHSLFDIENHLIL